MTPIRRYDLLPVARTLYIREALAGTIAAIDTSDGTTHANAIKMEHLESAALTASGEMSAQYDHELGQDRSDDQGRQQVAHGHLFDLQQPQ